MLGLWGTLGKLCGISCVRVGGRPLKLRRCAWVGLRSGWQGWMLRGLGLTPGLWGGWATRRVGREARKPSADVRSLTGRGCSKTAGVGPAPVWEVRMGVGPAPVWEVRMDVGPAPVWEVRMGVGPTGEPQPNACLWPWLSPSPGLVWSSKGDGCLN